MPFIAATLRITFGGVFLFANTFERACVSRKTQAKRFGPLAKYSIAVGQSFAVLA